MLRSYKCKPSWETKHGFKDSVKESTGHYDDFQESPTGGGGKVTQVEKHRRRSSEAVSQAATLQRRFCFIFVVFFFTDKDPCGAAGFSYFW